MKAYLLVSATIIGKVTTHTAQPLNLDCLYYMQQISKAMNSLNASATAIPHDCTHRDVHDIPKACTNDLNTVKESISKASEALNHSVEVCHNTSSKCTATFDKMTKDFSDAKEAAMSISYDCDDAAKIRRCEKDIFDLIRDADAIDFDVQEYT